MLVGGLTFLRICSRLSKSLNLRTLTTLQQTISSVEFTDYEKIALIAFSGHFLFVTQYEGYAHVHSQMFKSHACKNPLGPQRSTLSCTAGSPGEIRTPVSR